MDRKRPPGLSNAVPGLVRYQARKWTAWQHHMTLVALLFLLEERILQQQNLPLLSCADIETLLWTFLPRRDIEPGEVISLGQSG